MELVLLVNAGLTIEQRMNCGNTQSVMSMYIGFLSAV